MPASWQDKGPAGSRVVSGLLWAGWVCGLQDYGFLTSVICPLVGDSDLEDNVGFLEGRASACPLLGGVESVHLWAVSCVEVCLEEAVPPL